VGLTGLGLSDKVASEHGRLDSPLLDGGRLLETVRVDSAEEILGEFHGIKGLDGLIPVCLDVSIADSSESRLG
jgi:hypothetical protein